MNKLWVLAIVSGLVFGCNQSAEKKVVEQASIFEAEEEIVAKEVAMTYDDALEKYRYYEDKVRRIAYKSENEVINAYLDSALSAIEGSMIGDYTFVDIEDRVIETGELAKPLYLMTSASWCKPCIAKIPAFNKVVEEYHDRINFAVLFYDDESYVQKVAHDYHGETYLIPSTGDRLNGDININIDGFKHITSYPTSYLINPKKTILKLSQGACVSGDTLVTENFNTISFTREQALVKNHQSILNDIGILLGESIAVDVEEETQVHQKDYSSIKL